MPPGEIFNFGERVGVARKAGGKVTGMVKKICFAGGLEFGTTVNGPGSCGFFPVNRDV